jgi:hypothetical protein
MLIFPAGSRLVATLSSGTALVAGCTVFGQDIDASSQVFNCLGQTLLDGGAGSDNVLFTVPAGHSYLAKTLSISNPGTSSIQVVLHYLSSVAVSPSAATRISGIITIRAGGMGLYEDGYGWRFYSSNQSLAGNAATGTGGLELLGATQLAVSAPYSETVKFTPRDSLLIFVRSAGFGVADLPALRFNGSGSSYWSRYLHSAAGANTLTNVQTVSTSIARLGVNNSTRNRTFTIYMSNNATSSKVAVVSSMVGTGAAGTAPNIEFGGFEWVDTGRQISEMQLLSTGSQPMLAGTAFEIYGVTYST